MPEGRESGGMGGKGDGIKYRLVVIGFQRDDGTLVLFFLKERFQSRQKAIKQARIHWPQQKHTEMGCLLKLGTVTQGRA